jgi:predicted RNA binding protein YcfA (HicA-like mRNA interferase family)
VAPLPVLKVRVVVRALERQGFQVQRMRGKGSHRFMSHSDGRTTTVSGNPGDDVRRSRLAKILRDTRLTVEDLS